jgi:hypothetical protein
VLTFIEVRYINILEEAYSLTKLILYYQILLTCNSEQCGCVYLRVSVCVCVYYVRMYVCMYVCMHVCMYDCVCMYEYLPMYV